jgi:Ran GTPase-activating protein (RanGAP) involved in mRNA processing and transport
MSEQQNPQPDMVNHPVHYNKHPRGIEVIDFVEHMDFCTGNAIKYIARAEYKGNEIQDLQKAMWYIQRKIDTLHEKQENREKEEKLRDIDEHLQGNETPLHEVHQEKPEETHDNHLLSEIPEASYEILIPEGK